MPSPSPSDVLWCLCSTIFRARYSLLTLAVPPILAALALYVWPRGTLYSLLLPRGFRAHHGVSRRRALVDLFWISFTSFCIATLACAGVGVAATHGPERTPSYVSVAAGCIYWPELLLVIAAGVSLILPVACISIWQREQPDESRSSVDGLYGLIGVAAGALSAAALILLLGVVRQSLFGSEDWILPVRPPERWSIDCTATGSRILAAVGAAFDTMGCRDGYLGADKHLLAGQAELVLSVASASLVYVGSLIALSCGRKPNVRFCTAVYLLVCIGTAGVILSGAAFWLDRFSVPTMLVAALVVTGAALLAKTDHFFELRPRHSAAPSTAVPAIPSLAECFAKRIASIPADANGVRTAIVVTASGGGIQAAAWTAEVLTGLAERFPEFEASLCLLSGVSGGSVGTGEFVAGTYIDPPRHTPGERIKRWESIRNRARASLLEQVAWGVAFADLPRLFTGFVPSNRLIDRGWAIEQLLERRLRFAENDRSLAGSRKATTIRDLCEGVGSGSMPVPLFNATCVQTGQRVIISPVRFSSDPHAGSRSLHMPADYSQGEFHADPTLATAIRLSATFSYASPVARPTRADEADWKRALESTAASSPAAPPATWFGLHLCDGGYADNTGVVAATEAGRELLQAIGQDRSGKKIRILFVRIEPFPRPTSREADAENGFSQVILGPAFGLLAARIATQQERADRDIDQFIRDACSQGVEAFQTTFRFGDGAAPPADFENPPLSWLLSSRQQCAIERAWKAVVTPALKTSDIVGYARSLGEAAPLA